MPRVENSLAENIERLQDVYRDAPTLAKLREPLERLFQSFAVSQAKRKAATKAAASSPDVGRPGIHQRTREKICRLWGPGPKGLMSKEAIARECGVSDGTVRNVLKAAGLTPPATT